MNILKKRPLAILLCLVLGGFSLFIDITNMTRIIILCATLVMSIVFMFLKRLAGNRFTSLCCLSLCLGIVFSIAYSSIHFPNNYFDKTVNTVGIVYKVDYSTYGKTVFSIKTEEFEQKSKSYKLTVDCELEDSPLINVGDKVKLEGDLKQIENDSQFNKRRYMLGKGYVGDLKNITSLKIISTNNRSLAIVTSELRDRISELIISKTNKDTGGLISALITGERDLIDRNTVLDFRRIGISHILALSGMHLAILSFALSKFMSIFKLTKKSKSILISLFCVFYITLTGFSPSVTRAGIMLVISSILFLLSSTRDSVTSLCISVFIIVLCTPYSVYDISLWLSAFSTLGIIIYFEFIKPFKIKNRILRGLTDVFVGSLMASFFAITSSLLVTTNSFDKISVLSPFTTVIFSFLAQILIYAGLLILLSFGTLPIGNLTILFCDGIKEFANAISSIKWVEVYTDFMFFKVLSILLIVSFFLFLILKIKHKKLYITAVMLLFIVLLSSATVHNSLILKNDNFDFTSDRTGETFLLKSESEVCLVYSGASAQGAEKEIQSLIDKNKLVFIDRFILTNYSKRAVELSKNIISRYKIKCLYIPRSQTDEEHSIAKDMANMLSRFGTKLKFYKEKEFIKTGNYSYWLISHEPLFEKSKVQNALLFKVDNKYTTYLSRGLCQNAIGELNLLLNGSHNLILGRQGVRYKENYAFDLIFDKLEKIIICDDLTLTPYAEKYYNKKGTSITYVDVPFK